jgi:hypothetical protein
MQNLYIDVVSGIIIGSLLVTVFFTHDKATIPGIVLALMQVLLRTFEIIMGARYLPLEFMFLPAAIVLVIYWYVSGFAGRLNLYSKGMIPRIEKNSEE